MSELSVKKVALVGFAIPNSNKNNGAEITLDDLKVIKTKVVKEKAEKTANARPEFDLKWNATRGIIVVKKSYVETNPSDEHGFTFMLTEANELLLIQSSSKNPATALRPKFLKGAKATPSFKSEYGEFVIRMYLDALNAEVEDGDFYLMSEDRHFALQPVEADNTDVTAVYQVVDKVWLSKQPVAEPVAEVAPVEAIEAVEGDVVHIDEVEAEVAEEVAEVVAESDAFETIDGVVIASIGENAE